MDFTVCSKVVEKASEDYKYAIELLMQFTSDNPHKVIINDKILNDYLRIAEEHNVINTWMKFMDYKRYWKSLTPVIQDNIYIETCKESFDKKFIVDEKEDYAKEQCVDLDIINKDEAIEQLKPVKKVKYKIVQKGKGNQASQGNNSPNTHKKDGKD